MASATSVTEAAVYGEVHVDKGESTNHVANPLAAALLKLPTPLPRGDILNDDTIQKLHSCNLIAIITNIRFQKIYPAIWAS